MTDTPKKIGCGYDRPVPQNLPFFYGNRGGKSVMTEYIRSVQKRYSDSLEEVGIVLDRVATFDFRDLEERIVGAFGQLYIQPERLALNQPTIPQPIIIDEYVDDLAHFSRIGVKDNRGRRNRQDESALPRVPFVATSSGRPLRDRAKTKAARRARRQRRINSG